MARKRMDVVGHRYGRLTVLREIDPQRPYGRLTRYVECRCDCGSTANVAVKSVRAGLIRSCGCARKPASQRNVARATAQHWSEFSREERFWAKVKVGDPDWCWEWTGNRLPSGYGYFTDTSASPYRKAYAHRRAYELTVGPIPSDLEVDHLCNTPYCANPRHIELVTRSENVRRRDIRRRRMRLETTA